MFFVVLWFGISVLVAFISSLGLNDFIVVVVVVVVWFDILGFTQDSVIWLL